jgi:RNA polymerase sigma factor (sigma-70 family)
MEASTLTHASSRAGILGRRSPLLKLQGDEKLVALIREGHEHAFEVLFERYHSRLLAFCRHMLRSQEDAEDVLQEVFVKAHAAMLADDRHINARPWLYRIARNRCLNHLRRPVPEGQDSMDVLVGEGGVTTAERVQRREEFRALVADVRDLPETQRTALLLREMDALSYEEIAETMDTTVPAVKSLLVRARMSLAEATQSRQLTCGEVRLELAEAAEGLRKASGPVRHHVKRCEPCREFRGELRSNTKALAALAPLGPLTLVWKSLIAKFGFGGSGTAASGSAAGGSAGIAGGSAVGGGAVAAGGGAAGGGGGAAAGAGGAAVAAGGTGAAAAAGGIGGAIGAKAAATAATAALLTAGAVEVRHIYSTDTPVTAHDGHAAAAISTPPEHGAGVATNGPVEHVAAKPAEEPAIETEAAPSPAAEQAEAPAPATEAPPADPATEETQAPPDENEVQEAVAGPAAGGAGAATGSGSSDDPDGPVVTVTPNPAVTPPPPPATEPAPPPPPPAEPATPPTNPAPPAEGGLDPTGTVPPDAVTP